MVREAGGLRPSCSVTVGAAVTLGTGGHACWNSFMSYGLYGTIEVELSSTAGSLSPNPPEPAGPKGLPNMQAALFF